MRTVTNGMYACTKLLSKYHQVVSEAQQLHQLVRVTRTRPLFPLASLRFEEADRLEEADVCLVQSRLVQAVQALDAEHRLTLCAFCTTRTFKRLHIYVGRRPEVNYDQYRGVGTGASALDF